MADRKNVDTGRKVNDSERGNFYANGRTRRSRKDDDETEKKVTSLPSGAKRDSYFKKREYY